MKTMHLNWNRSLATFVVLAALYGLEATVTVAQSDKPKPAPPPARATKIEAKLRQIIVPKAAFHHLPLGEVLRFLNDESIKLDPDKIGVNFLINPNVRRVRPFGAVNPATGLPMAAPAERFDVAAVNINFNLPLRHLTMRDLLNAIVLVADHPIEYALEDYAVVFSAKPEMLAGQAGIFVPSGLVPQPVQPSSPRPYIGPMIPERPRSPHRPKAELADIKPQLFNIDFGSGAPSKQVGPAATGRRGDFWNTVSVGFNNHHTESDLKFAGGDPSPIEVEMINLGGGWGNGGEMGVKAPMLDTFNYPVNNQGGDSTVILHQVPPGKYSVYIYGHGIYPEYYGDYTLTVGTREYGRKQTSHKSDAVRNTRWVEGSQYVKFSGVKVALGQSVELLIRPGEQLTLPDGRTICDAMICGLQLVPEHPSPSALEPFHRVPAGRPASVPPPPGLVSWWRGEGNATDAVGENHGTPVNGVAFPTGKVGRAFGFNGIDNYVEVPSSANLNPSGSFSIETWLYPRQDPDGEVALVCKWGDNAELANQRSYDLSLVSGGVLNFAISDEAHQWDTAFHAFHTDPEAVTLQTWNHVVAVYDQSSGTRRIFVNGIEAKSRTEEPVTICNGEAPLTFGAHVDGGGQITGYFEGLLDELSLYDRALTAAEIQAIYQAGSAGKRRPSR